MRTLLITRTTWLQIQCRTVRHCHTLRETSLSETSRPPPILKA